MPTINVSITGPTKSGKTTVAPLLQRALEGLGIDCEVNDDEMENWKKFHIDRLENLRKCGDVLVKIQTGQSLKENVDASTL